MRVSFRQFFDLTIQNAHNFGSAAKTKHTLGFRLSNNNKDYVNPSHKCYDWIVANNYTTPTCQNVTRWWGTYVRCYYPQYQAARWCPRSDSLISVLGMGFEGIHLPDTPFGVDCYQSEDPPENARKFPVEVVFAFLCF